MLATGQPHPSEEEILRIYRETIDDFYLAVSRRCEGDRDLTEDVVQETWLRAVREWRAKGLPSSPIAWMTTVARNLLLNEFRKRRHEPLDSVAESQGIELSPISEGRTAAESAVLIHEGLSRLPLPQNRLIKAFHLERHRVSQIARWLGISERAVEGRLRRARASLRREIQALIDWKE